MSPRFHKYKLLLDEGVPPRLRFPILNHRYNVKHIALDLKNNGMSDKEVYKLAAKQDRIVVTYNIKDYIVFVETDSKSGVIGISTNLSTS